MNIEWIASLKRPLPTAKQLDYFVRGCRQMVHGIEMGRVEVVDESLISVLRLPNGPEKLRGLFAIYDAWREHLRRRKP